MKSFNQINSKNNVPSANYPARKPRRSSDNLQVTRLILPICIVTFIFLFTNSGIVEAVAFPGAEGFGAESVGGRGGTVIEVTNLNDDGPGSLRAAVEASGPRTVVFRTGGTIILESGLEIDNPFITIAGQTAPGGGITLRNSERNGGTAIKVITNDVIIRYLRVRPGPGGQPDAIAVARDGTNNVIIDHCSMSWAVDENFSTYKGVHDVTVQWSIISEGLNNSTHRKGSHSAGALIGSEGATNISLHHNLFAHNAQRNPRIKTAGIVDVVNNVIYNPGFRGGSGPSHVTDGSGGGPVNYVGNYYEPGVNSDSADWLVSTDGGVEIFVQGNFVPNDVVDPDNQEWVVPTRHDAAPVTTTSATEAFNQVLTDAGATLPRRDTVDQRIAEQARNMTGGQVIDDPSEVGGWPALDNGTPPVDEDHDGMPDPWEELHNLSEGTGDADGDGFTNLEEFLNGTNPGTDPEANPPDPETVPTEEEPKQDPQPECGSS